MERSDWRAAVWAAHRAGGLTRASRDTLLTLSTYGREIWPAHATLAERVRCHIKTVGRALAAGYRLGLLSWRARRWRAASGAWRRLSNVYRLRLPPIGHFAPAGEKSERKQVPTSLTVAQQLSLATLPLDRALALRRRWLGLEGDGIAHSPSAADGDSVSRRERRT